MTVCDGSQFSAILVRTKRRASLLLIDMPSAANTENIPAKSLGTLWRGSAMKPCCLVTSRVQVQNMDQASTKSFAPLGQAREAISQVARTFPFIRGYLSAKLK